MPAMLPLAALLLAAAPAQSPPQPADIVVTGRDRDEALTAARRFVRGVSATPVDGQFARWTQPYCPAVGGLPAPLGQRVLGRVRQVAEEAGAPLGKPDCRPNALIDFTPDARGLIARLERRSPRLLAQMPLAERADLRGGPAPVRWWYSTISEGADGGQLAAMPSVSFGPIGSSGPVIPIGDRTKTSESYRSSIISTGLRATISAAVVLVDVPLATGWRLDAVADYAAFVSLARAKPQPPEGATDTILTLFSTGADARPVALTVGDRAYLSALYAIPADRPARAQARAIAGRVARGQD